MTDFAGQLKNTIRETAVHIRVKFKVDNTSEISTDTVFWLMGTILISEKVKAWTPNIYPHLVKTMDNLLILCLTASSIASDAQQYLRVLWPWYQNRHHNQLQHHYILHVQTTTIKSTYKSANLPKETNAKNKQAADPFKSVNKNHQMKQCQIRPQLKLKSDTQRRETDTCRNYRMDRTCFHRYNWPYQHSPPAQEHVTAMEDEIPTTNTFSINDLDFQYRPNKMWWLVPWSTKPIQPSKTYASVPVCQNHFHH